MRGDERRGRRKTGNTNRRRENMGRGERKGGKMMDSREKEEA